MSSRRWWRPGWAVASVLAAAAAACGGGGEAGSPSNPMSNPMSVETSVSPRRPVATTSDATATRTSIRIVSQNLLHGRDCAPDTARCRLDARVALFVHQLEDADCPEVVAVQEADTEMVAALRPLLATCGYVLVWDDDPGIDRELVLTTLDVVDSVRVPLAGGFRTAFAVRLDSDAGAVDVVTTHLSSSSDDVPCDRSACPPTCAPGMRQRDCQAEQLVELATGLDDAGAITVVGGDLNATADEPGHAVLTDAAFVDSHLAAGRPECTPSDGANCTAGRGSTSIAELADSTARQRERIDYLFFAPLPAGCTIAHDTGLFHPDPQAGPIAHPSDHTGVQLALDCPSTGPASPAPFPAVATTETSTTVDGAAAVDAASTAAITTAFETLFDGSNPDLDARLAMLEGGDRMRAAFSALLDAAGPAAASTSVRVESVALGSESTAEVVFDVLLDGAVIFDGRNGSAVRSGGRWVVSERTFCELATILAPDVAGC